MVDNVLRYCWIVIIRSAGFERDSNKGKFDDDDDDGTANIMS